MNLKLLSLIVLAGASGCAVPPAPPLAPVRITILHTNDHHGRFWRNADNEYGLAARKTLIDRVRAEVKAEGGYTLLLDAGDINTGVPESDMQGAEPDFRGMSALGYDAMAVGNHEFDRNLATMRRQQTEWSTFPWLSANIYRDGARMFEPYRLFTLGPVRIAVLGLTTDDTAKFLDAKKFPGVSFVAPASEAERLVPALRRQADVVIATTHMGHYTDGKHGVSAPGDVELARAVGGIDLIVGGHSQNPVCMLQENVRNDAYVPGQPCAPDRQNGAWIVQAHEWGKYLGRADFEYRAGRFELVKYALLPVNLRKPDHQPYGAEVPEDPALLALLRPYQERGAAELSVPVGRSDAKFDGDRVDVRSKATNLGVLVTTAMMEKVQADLAVTSSGGLRDSLPAGPLTYRDLLTAQPFGNQLCVVTLTGAELAQYLRAVAKMTPGSGAFLQSAGVRMVVDDGVATEMRVKGQAIDPQANYRLAVYSFVAKGGDGYPDLSQHPGYVNTGYVDAEVLRDFIARRGALRAADFDPGDSVTRR